MPFDEALAQRLRLLFGELSGSSERHMFGGVCFMVAGKMCCGIVGRDLMVRVGRSPGRSPPYWKSRVLRRQVLGDEDDAAGRGHRAGEEVA